MSLNQTQAEAILVNFYKSNLPTLMSYSSTNLDDYVAAMRIHMKVASIAESFKHAMGEAMLTARAFEQVFRGVTATDSDYANPAQFVDRLSTAELVNFLYPNAADKAAFTNLVTNGTLTNSELLYGASVAGVSATPNQIVLGASIVTDKVYSGTVTVPVSPLHFDGVNLAQQDFVVAMYASAFNRSAEFDGLRYWTNKLSAELSRGTDQASAYKAISQEMYRDGKGNGEGGTALGDAAYVNYAYQNILGRTGDASGVQYWNSMLSSGSIDRGSFVAQFVGDALANSFDQHFLQSRIAVSKWVAQEHVSGPSAPGIDLRAVIQPVTDSASAVTAINAIVQKYGNAPATKTAFELASLMSSWTDATASEQSVSGADLSSTAIELSAAVAPTYDAFGLVA